MIFKFWKQKIDAGGGGGRAAGLAKMEEGDVLGWRPSATPKTRSQGVPCERVHYHASVWSERLKSCFRSAGFVVLLQFSEYNSNFLSTTL